MKNEFNKINETFEEHTIRMESTETKMLNIENEISNKIDRTDATIRVIQSDLKAQAKFLAKKNDDSKRLQEVIASFKDRMMEKQAVLADEYTQQFRDLFHKNESANGAMERMGKLIDNLQAEQRLLKSQQFVDIKNLKHTNEEVEALKACYKFEDRISLLEN